MSSNKSQQLDHLSFQEFILTLKETLDSSNFRFINFRFANL